jgi:6-pyruvoyl tetrahydropterin synthase/QueD family protein
MKKIRVTKVFTFDMAHALFGYDGPCKNIHGHTYRLSVTLIGEQIQEENNPKEGMVIDFTDFKRIVKENVIDIIKNYGIDYDKKLVVRPIAQFIRELCAERTIDEIVITDENGNDAKKIYHSFSNNSKLKVYTNIKQIGPFLNKLKHYTDLMEVLSFLNHNFLFFPKILFLVMLRFLML